MGRKKPANRKSQKHDFESIPEFDKTMRKLVTIPKDQLEKTERKAKKPAKRKK